MFTVILKGVLIKDHVVKLERGKELKQKTNMGQFQASNCPDVKISASAIFSTTLRCLRIHKPSRLLVM